MRTSGAIALALAATTTACTLLHLPIGSGGSVAEDPGRRHGIWDGPECKRSLYQLDELGGYDYNAKDTIEDASPEAQVLLQVCVRREKDGYADHTIPQHPRIRELGEEQGWLAQDDWRPDVVAAAVYAVSIAARRSHDTMMVNQTEIGLALFWTQVLTPEAVDHALASVKVPAGAKSALVSMFQAVPARLNGTLNADEQKIYVALPLEVYRNRQQHYATFRKFYERLDPLRAEAQAARDDVHRIDRVVADLQRLRSEFFAACGKIECRAMPLYAHATSELAQLYVLRGNALAARAESLLYSREGSYVAGLPQAVHAAQSAKLHQLEEAWTKYQHVKASGGDDKSARRLAGDVPTERPNIRLLDLKLSLPFYAAALEKADRDSTNAVVDHVEGNTIVFKTDRTEYEESYNCQRTNRITRINIDGTIDYEENCQSRTVHGSQLQHAPVTVPTKEASALRRGDSVTFVVDGKAGLVVEVHRGERVVQVRGDHVAG